MHTRERQRKKGGGSVLSKYRPQQQHSLKYFIASSPEMKKGGSQRRKKERLRKREREREMSKWRGGLRGSGETEIRTIGIVKNRKKKEEQKRIRRGRKKEERLEARESNPSSSFLCKIRLKYFGISSDKWCITADKRKRVIFLCMRSRNL